MAINESIKKKLIKRSKLTNLKTSSPSMATSSSSRSSSTSKLSYRRIVITLSVFVFSSAIVLLRISSNIWYKFAFGDDDRRDSIYTVEVVNEFPHDRNAFTQGLLYAGNNTLYESTGLYHQSSVRKVALQTGKVMDIQRMDGSHFGEGLTLLGERLFQVTWKKKTGFIYDKNNLSNFEKFSHQMQDGWGLATDGKVLFGSDGTSTLYQIDPKTLKVIGKQLVKYKDYEVHNLNELEFINGEIWANVWMTDCIARISQKDGIVLGWVLLPQLRKELTASGERNIDVLNGIAWDSDKNRIFVTGKLWPKLYEIKLHPKKKHIDGVIEKFCLREPFNF